MIRNRWQPILSHPDLSFSLQILHFNKNFREIIFPIFLQVTSFSLKIIEDLLVNKMEHHLMNSFELLKRKSSSSE